MLPDLPKTIVIIPCYNEESRLDINAFTAFAAEHPHISLWLADDGSTDNTGHMIEEMCTLPNLRALRFSPNRGKAETVRRGILAALEENPDLVGFWDADLATPLNVIPDFITKFAGNEHLLMVTGCRLKRLGALVEREPLRHLLGRVFATIVSNHLRLPIYDTQCGAKVLTARAAGASMDKPFASRWFFDVEIYKRLMFRFGRDAVHHGVFEYPLPVWLDKPGSKVRLFAAGMELLKVLRSKP